MAVTIKINPCPERYNSANPYKTGQTTSYASNDDGDLERGRGSDFTTLDFNNPFGNTNRFTDTTGAQTYANDIVIDWSTTNYINETVIGWYGVVLGGGGVFWATAIAAQPVTAEGYNDWVIPNAVEGIMAINFGSTTLSHLLVNSSPNLWTSTTRPDDTARAIGYNATNPFQTNKNALLANYMVLRTFTFTELGL